MARAGDIGLFRIVERVGRRRRCAAHRGSHRTGGTRLHHRARIRRCVRLRSWCTARAMRCCEQSARGARAHRASWRRRFGRSRTSSLRARAVTWLPAPSKSQGVKVVAARVEGADAGALRAAVDQLKSRLGSAVIVLASVESDSKVVLVAGVTADQTAPQGRRTDCCGRGTSGRQRRRTGRFCAGRRQQPGGTRLARLRALCRGCARACRDAESNVGNNLAVLPRRSQGMESRRFIRPCHRRPIIRAREALLAEDLTC